MLNTIHPKDVANVGVVTQMIDVASIDVNPMLATALVDLKNQMRAAADSGMSKRLAGCYRAVQGFVEHRQRSIRKGDWTMIREPGALTGLHMGATRALQLLEGRDAMQVAA